jgi:hypothetical protein
MHYTPYSPPPPYSLWDTVFILLILDDSLEIFYCFIESYFHTFLLNYILSGVNTITAYLLCTHPSIPETIVHICAWRRVVSGVYSLWCIHFIINRFFLQYDNLFIECYFDMIVQPIQYRHRLQ